MCIEDDHRRDVDMVGYPPKAQLAPLFSLAARIETDPFLAAVLYVKIWQMAICIYQFPGSTHKHGTGTKAYTIVEN